MTRVAIPGCAGRMGKALVQAVSEAEGLSVGGCCEAAGSPAVGMDIGLVAGLAPLGVAVVDSLEAMLQGVDAVIDFSLPPVTERLAPLCAERGLALVVGTTGLSDEQRVVLAGAAEKVPLVWAPNMSVGVNVLLKLVADATRLLGPDFGVEVVEAHHGRKRDAPSGTALRIAEEVAKNSADRGTLEERLVHGREGDVGQRPPDEIGLHAVRGGDVVGEHTVMYLGEGERVELVHRASSRQTFARGAVRALTWALTQPAGLHDMQDVLGMR